MPSGHPLLSVPSSQSSCPSHTQESGIHSPDEQLYPEHPPLLAILPSLVVSPSLVPTGQIVRRSRMGLTSWNNFKSSSTTSPRGFCICWEAAVLIRASRNCWGDFLCPLLFIFFPYVTRLTSSMSS